jgi:type II secretory pathway pseudopilin PulG
MYQEPPIEPSVFSKLIAIWGVVVVIIIGTALVAGGQVYWWQKAVVHQEQQKLQQQIRDLKNEIQVLKSNLPLENSTNKGIQKTKLTVGHFKAIHYETKLQNELGGREKRIIVLLSNDNLESLAQYVHPEKGLRFTMDSEVNTKTDIVFSKDKLIDFFRSHRLYNWGYDEENGMPVRLNPTDYYQNFVYDAPYADTREISYLDATSIGFATSNCFEVYPRSIVVEYRVSEAGSPEKVGANWRSIRLVFEKYRKTWFLTGIIHEQWML